MNKTPKIILLIVICFFVVIVTYLFLAKKTNLPLPIPTVSQKLNFKDISGGCGKVFVYKITTDDSTGISVSADAKKLNLSAEGKTFEIGNTEGLNVEILMGERIGRLYCNDVVYSDQQEPKKFIAKSGRVIISIADAGKDPELSGNYKTTVILNDVRFNDSDIVIDELIFKDVRVGWYPG